MATNFNQILDEIQQQKLQVATLIDDNTAKIEEYQTFISNCQNELLTLQDQLAGLATLEERTQELQASANDINININVQGAGQGGTSSYTVPSSPNI
tara:strand:- start:278 stop:568 length:291 start_codon:yes stop_codon:yes gene_type:complete